MKKPVMGETLHNGLIHEKKCLSINIDVVNNSPTTIKKFALPAAVLFKPISTTDGIATQ